MTTLKTLTLYDQDFQLWIEDTVAKLQNKEVADLDWEHLIEEISCLGKSEKRELESRLGVLLIHLLKRCYVNNIYDYRGWENTIDEQRRELQLLLKQSPSLKGYFLEAIADNYRYALRQVRRDYEQVDFPEDCPFMHDVAMILNQDFWV